jgi:hypothetical protein
LNCVRWWTTRQRAGRNVLILDIPDFVQALAKCKNGFAPRFERNAIEEPDHRHRRLLRTRRERPRRCRRTYSRYECTPSHSFTSSAATCSVSGTARSNRHLCARCVAKWPQ